MDKYDFIKRLDNALSALSEPERESALRYYKDLFEDAGYENESDLLEKLGSPEAIADSIIKESGMITNQTETESENTEKDFFDESDFTKKTDKKASVNNKASLWLVILIVIITFPLWIGVVASLFGVTIALIVTAFALTVAFTVAGVTCFFTGIGLITVSLGSAFIVSGIGLILIGIVMLLLIPCVKMIFKLCGWIINSIAKLCRSLFGFDKKVVA